MDFVDSNVWHYALVRGADPLKRKAAATIVSHRPCVLSTQVINEVCVNLMRKAAFDDRRIERLIRAFYRRCAVVPVNETTMLAACRLRGSYSLSFWDSLIVAAALAAGCARLYSEDLCDGQLIEGSLKIVNPFAQNVQP
jgi:predicted nucleic acid-binding protein